MTDQSSLFLSDFIINRINVGIMAVDQQMNIVLWNKFMETHSGRKSDELIGKNLFEAFPELPAKWLNRKIQSVFLLKNFAFTSWRQRPYLFQFKEHHAITGGVDWMRQDCTFLPVKNDHDEVEFVCITIVDATETSMYQDQLRESMAAYEKLSKYDGLTGLYNRKNFEENLIYEFKRSQRYNNLLSFAILDLDHFKNVNDQYGHLAGDEVLKTTAKVIQNITRDTDICGRYGGEEFGVILPGANAGCAFHALKRLRLTLEDTTTEFEEHSIRVTMSIGFTQYHGGMKTYEDLIREADAALYKSKENGRNRITRYTPVIE